MSNKPTGGDLPADTPLTDGRLIGVEHAAGSGGAAESVDQVANSLDGMERLNVHVAHIATKRHEFASDYSPVNFDRPELLQPWAMTDGGESVEDIGARVAMLRRWAGFDSQTAFAVSIGLDPSEINHYESGRRRLALTAAQRLRARYRVTLDWLYYGDRSGLSLEIDRSLPHLADMPPAAPPKRGRRKKTEGD